jgi:hypothetical protein
VTPILPPGYVSILHPADILEQSLFAGLPDNPISDVSPSGACPRRWSSTRSSHCELWKAVDAEKLRAMAVGERPRRMVRLDPSLTKQIPWLRSP